MDTGAPFEIMALGKPFGFFLEKTGEKKERSKRAMANGAARWREGSSSPKLKTAADTDTDEHANTYA